MNELKMSLQQSILTLWNHGWTFRRIARELQIRRETVSKYIHRQMDSKAAKVPPGDGVVPEPKAAKVPAGSPEGPVAPEVPAGLPARSRSQCEPWREVIEQGLREGLSAQRLYQDLVGCQYAGSYDAVKRFVRRLQAAAVVPFCRIEVEPGQEAQVDFGLGAWVVDESGKRRRPNLYRIVLSHSRKGYTEAVWRQRTEDFIRCLENSFRSWGGAPKTLVIDNLRAAVNQADWYDPELNVKVAEFCRHYGTVMLPCKPKMPRHKGKVEAGVKYAQNNALKGRTFHSLAEQNQFLLEWESGVADTRIHGTTRQQVGKIFNEVERSKLLPLPPDLFPVFEEAPRTVHGDGYIELQRAYYSVPPEYVGRPVWVRWESRLVRVFNQRREVIAVHVRVEPGKFATDLNHLRSPYRCFVQRGLDYLLDRARAIGPQTGSWAEAMARQRGPIAVRVLHGLISLAEKHPAKALENAAQKALHHGTWRLRDLRTLLEQAGPPPQLDFLETHPLIRNLETYRDYVPDCFAPNTQNLNSINTTP